MHVVMVACCFVVFLHCVVDVGYCLLECRLSSCTIRFMFFLLFFFFLLIAALTSFYSPSANAALPCLLLVFLWRESVCV